MSNTVPLVLAQQGGPTYGHRDAYEGGRKVGEIMVYVMFAAVLIWGLLKLFGRR
jgi:hypothetical protein